MASVAIRYCEIRSLISVLALITYLSQRFHFDRTPQKWVPGRKLTTRLFMTTNIFTEHSKLKNCWPSTYKLSSSKLLEHHASLRISTTSSAPCFALRGMSPARGLLRKPKSSILSEWLVDWLTVAFGVTLHPAQSLWMVIRYWFIHTSRRDWFHNLGMKLTWYQASAVSHLFLQNRWTTQVGDLTDYLCRMEQ